MPRFRWIAILTAVAALVCAGVATAAATRVTAGTSQLTLSSGANTALTASHLTITPGAPATQSGSTFTFPVMSGRVNTTTMTGHVAHWGRLIFSNGTRTFRVRRPYIQFNGATANVYGYWAGEPLRTCVADPTASHPHGRSCTATFTWYHAFVGTITGITAANSSATGTLYPSDWLATAINKLAGSQVASSSTALGTLSTAVSS